MDNLIETRLLIRHLSYLPPKLRRSFKDFLASPYFNKKPTLQHAYAIILEELNKSKWILTDQQLYQKLYGARPYNKQVLGNLFSKLSRLLEHFLAIERFEEEPLLKNMFYLEHAADYIPSSKLERKIAKLKTDNTHQPTNYQHLINDRMLSLEANGTQRFMEKIKRSREKVLWSHAEMKIMEMKTCCEYLASASLVPTFLEDPSLDQYFQEQIRMIRDLPLEEGKEGCYQLAIRLLDEKSEVAYENLKESLLKWKTKLTREEWINLISILRNFCVKKINQGDVGFQEEYIALCQEQIDYTQRYTKQLVTNLTIVCCRGKAYTQAEDFLNQYLQLSDAPDKESIAAYCRATIAYYQFDYQRSLKILGKINARGIHYQLQIKYLIMSNLYHLNEDETAKSFAESFRIFLLRNKVLSTDRRKNNLNFILFFKRLLNLHHSPPSLKLTKDLEKLYLEIQHCKQLVNKKWLSEKVEQRQAEL